MAGRLRRIHYLYRHRVKPLAALWRWAKRPRKRKYRMRRWYSLARWAGWVRSRFRKGSDEAKAWWRRRRIYYRRYRYLKRKIAWLRKNRDPEPVPSDELLVTFDGKLVPRWMAAQALAPARASGIWRGYVFSGYRSPEYSEQLCYNMCGAPSCPGRCAGRASNHAAPPSGRGYAYEGAVDVTDSAGLQRWCRAHGNPIRGNGEALPSDTPHFSRSGR